jgi:DNA-binding XRE family transcriptional regulator
VKIKYENTGSLIRDRRVIAGFTQRKLAEIINVPASTLCQWEKGYLKDFPLTRAHKLCTHIELDLTYLAATLIQEQKHVEKLQAKAVQVR